MSSPKRQASRTGMARKQAPAHKAEPKKTPSRSSRSRKKPSGSILANLPLPRWSLKAISNDRKLDILGVTMALIGMLTILSLVSSTNGAVTGWWVVSVKKIAGLGSFILPIVLILVGVWLVLRNVERLPMLSLERITGLTLLYLNILGWLHILLEGGWDLADLGGGGGYLGAVSERTLVSALGEPGAYIFLVAWSLIAVALTLDISVSELFQFLQKTLASLARRVKTRVDAERTIQAARTPAIPSPSNRGMPALPPEYKPIGGMQFASGSPVGTQTASSDPNLREKEKNLRISGENPSGQPPKSGDAPSEAPGTSVSRPSTSRKAGNPTSAPAQTAPPLPPWKSPNISDILDPAGQEMVKTNQDTERGQIIVDTLTSFGAPVKVVTINHGPTVTQYGVEPLYIENRNGQTRVRVSKVVALADDLALALAAPRIRIQAPVPGRNYIGIEVPNLEISRVLLREVMESDAYRKLKSPLRFALGKDVAGHPKVYDLAAMPHLLIAGTTGSGKSVCVNSILSCLLINNTPNELRMILVDPKRVELTGYNGIPHLLAPVVVEAEQVVGALQWVQREMDARYHRFSQVGARNIVDYNSRNAPILPYMLVLIDELADLMMLAPDETERSLSRLAQLARATGIHLVLATQRPSVDVVTGLIKANFPARIAFAVASGIDSRVILDQPGAERLLGRGDMLFQAPDAAAPVRLQGVFVDDPEIQSLVEYWRQQAYELRNVNVHSATAEPVNMDLPLNTPLKQTPLWGEDDNGKPGDPVLPEAIKIVREEGKASISMLQRKLRIGYTRAARLVDQLEERGIIGPSVSTSQVREVLDFGDGNNAESQNSLGEDERH